MNTSNRSDDELFDYLTHPHHWPGTDVILRMRKTRSVLHYNVLLNRYYWYLMSGDSKLPDFEGTRLGHHELCKQLVEEGWTLDD